MDTNKGLNSSNSGSLAHSLPPYAPELSGAGRRIKLDTSLRLPFADWKSVAPAPCTDSNGSPIYLGSATFDNSVHPCKIGPHLEPPCRVPYGGSEVEHYGRYNLLPFDEERMEWVPISCGRVPAHHIPVEGGYEENRAKLYHALATVHGTRVPGKTGQHLGGCRVAYGGREHHFKDGYHILCWKN